MPRPLIKLVMIVKNEAHGIADTIRSFANWIDRWLILDTGSTDGTQDIILETLANIPGRLVEEPFVNFAVSRNRSIELAMASDYAEYLLIADSDNRLHGGLNLREFLSAQAAADPDCTGLGGYNIGMQSGDIDLTFVLTIRSGSEWRLKGVTQEVMVHPSGRQPDITIPGVSYSYVAGAKSTEASQARHYRDAGLLETFMRDNPNDTRACFYLGQSYDCVNELAHALRWYLRRVQLGGWVQEVYHAQMRAGLVYCRMKKLPEAQAALLAAYNVCPYRAEALYYLAMISRELDQWHVTKWAAEKAASLPMPAAGELFLDRAIHTWRAWDELCVACLVTKDWAAGVHAGTRALVGYGKHDGRLQANLDACIKGAEGK